MRKVIISVLGTQEDASGEKNRMELVSQGKHYQKNNRDFFRYEESEISGLEGTTTTIRIDAAEVCVLRMGQIEQKLVFEEGKTNTSLYRTPYGDFALLVKTHFLAVDLQDGCGQIHVDYELAINDQWQSKNQLVIQIREDKQ